MAYSGPGLVVLCVDGGVPNIVATWNFFSPHRRLPGVADTGAAPLRSVFPSSTAPGHASFLTGAEADGHGIVANRFWERETVAEIRRRASNPVETLHPYESHSLQLPSLIDWFTDRQAKVAAVHFPQSFSRTAHNENVASTFCLYAPARLVRIALAGLPRQTGLSYFDESVALDVRRAGDGLALSLGAAGPSTVVREGEAVQLETAVSAGWLSVPLSYSVCADEVVLDIGTAALTLRFGAAAKQAARVDGQGGPASLRRSYTANPEIDFFEIPSPQWVCREVLRSIDEYEPDVVFVRFNQADHAQEFLYWHATRAESGDAHRARDQILEAYQTIDDCLGEICRAVGPQADYVLFSDHGIDYVERRIRPNAVLAELGLTDAMVFQGDSRVAYLYADEPVRADVADRILAALARIDPSIAQIDAERARALRIPSPSAGGRTGHLIVLCGLHAEFAYGQDGPVSGSARTASHGYLPEAPSMHGFVRMFGPHVPDLVLPGALSGAAGTVKALWERRRTVAR